MSQRKTPSVSAKECDEGHAELGRDGESWYVVKSGAWRKANKKELEELQRQGEQVVRPEGSRGTTQSKTVGRVVNVPRQPPGASSSGAFWDPETQSFRPIRRRTQHPPPALAQRTWDEDRADASDDAQSFSDRDDTAAYGPGHRSGGGGGGGLAEDDNDVSAARWQEDEVDYEEDGPYTAPPPLSFHSQLPPPPPPPPLPPPPPPPPSTLPPLLPSASPPLHSAGYTPRFHDTYDQKQKRRHHHHHHTQPPSHRVRWERGTEPHVGADDTPEWPKRLHAAHPSSADTATHHQQLSPKSRTEEKATRLPSTTDHAPAVVAPDLYRHVELPDEPWNHFHSTSTTASAATRPLPPPQPPLLLMATTTTQPATSSITLGAAESLRPSPAASLIAGFLAGPSSTTPLFATGATPFPSSFGFDHDIVQRPATRESADVRMERVVFMPSRKRLKAFRRSLSPDSAIDTTDSYRSPTTSVVFEPSAVTQSWWASSAKALRRRLLRRSSEYEGDDRMSEAVEAEDDYFDLVSPTRRNTDRSTFVDCTDSCAPVALMPTRHGRSLSDMRGTMPYLGDPNWKAKQQQWSYIPLPPPAAADVAADEYSPRGWNPELMAAAYPPPASTYALANPPTSTYALANPPTSTYALANPPASTYASTYLPASAYYIPAATASAAYPPPRASRASTVKRRPAAATTTTTTATIPMARHGVPHASWWGSAVPPPPVPPPPPVKRSARATTRTAVASLIPGTTSHRRRVTTSTARAAKG